MTLNSAKIISPNKGSIGKSTLTGCRTNKSCGVEGSKIESESGLTGKFQLILLTGQEERVEQEAIFHANSGEFKWGSAGPSIEGATLVKLVSSKKWGFH